MYLAKRDRGIGWFQIVFSLKFDARRACIYTFCGNPMHPNLQHRHSILCNQSTMSFVISNGQSGRYSGMPFVDMGVIGS